MELKVFESPEKEWDEFASRYTDLIFYQSVWSEVLRRGLGGQPLCFFLKEKRRISDLGSKKSFYYPVAKVLERE
jgi:hypothetical protein